MLDLGGGDGADSVRLAAAGHAVTVVDQAAGMLGRSRAAATGTGYPDRWHTVEANLLDWRPDGAYDLVLCHFVLQALDRDDELRVWRLLREVVRPGGTASVICPNPVSDVLSAVYRDGDVELALRRFHGEGVRSTTFDHEMRRLTPGFAERDAAQAGFEVIRRLGLRVAVDVARAWQLILR